MATEAIETRVIAGIRFVDVATNTAVSVPLRVRAVAPATPILCRPNQSNTYVLMRAPGFEEYIASFLLPPAAPAVGSVALLLEVRDPSGSYLAREFAMQLPRTTDRSLPDNAFEVVEVPVFRSPRASRFPNWALLRVHLTDDVSGSAVPAALLRVVFDPTGQRQVLGWGMSVAADPAARTLAVGEAASWVHFGADHVGEASVPVVGLSTRVWAVEPGEDVVLDNIPATLEVVPLDVPAGRLPDPSAMFGEPAAPQNSLAIALSVGGEINLASFTVST